MQCVLPSSGGMFLLSVRGAPVTTASTHAGGPVIDMKYGRRDAVSPEDCVDEGNLPAGNKPFPDADNAQVSGGTPGILVRVSSCGCSPPTAVTA